MDNYGEDLNPRRSAAMESAFDPFMRLVDLYRRGLVGPSEMWGELLNVLPAELVNDFLGQCDDSDQELLFSEYHGFASYRFTEAAIQESESPDTVLAFRSWFDAH